MPQSVDLRILQAYLYQIVNVIISFFHTQGHSKHIWWKLNHSSLRKATMIYKCFPFQPSPKCDACRTKHEIRQKFLNCFRITESGLECSVTKTVSTFQNGYWVWFHFLSSFIQGNYRLKCEFYRKKGKFYRLKCEFEKNKNVALICFCNNCNNNNGEG